MKQFLEVKNLYFSYDQDHIIFNNFSFEIAEKSITKLEGKNGSGKSTLLNLLTGIYSEKKLDGEIYYKGNNIDPSKLAKKISYICVDNQLFSGLNAYENINLFAQLFNEKKDYNSKVLNTCLLLGFDEVDLRKKCMYYSSGMLQKLWLSLMLSRSVELFFIDEPFRALDIESQNIITNLINNCNKTVLLVIHEPINNLKISNIINLDDTLIKN